MVLWMQELLASAIPSEQTDGVFGPQTLANLRSFQAAHRITATGQTGPATWHALLRLRAVTVRWAAAHSSRQAHRTSQRGADSPIAPTPRSATLPAVSNEIHKPTGSDGGHSL